MDTKLTLKLDQDIIEHAKRYAQRHQQSLSALVERYFRVLLDQEHPRARTEISPTVKALSGIIALDHAGDLHDDYTTYLIQKYR